MKLYNDDQYQNYIDNVRNITSNFVEIMAIRILSLEKLAEESTPQGH